MSEVRDTAVTGKTLGKNGMRAMRIGGAIHSAVYRLSGGRVGGGMRGAPVLLLHHTGRKSGKRRTTPLLYLGDGEDYVVVGSAGGARSDPAWVFNLRTNPAAAVRVGKRQLRVRAKIAGGEEKARLWPKLVALWPDYATYQAGTSRDIPVIVLRPEDGATA